MLPARCRRKVKKLHLLLAVILCSYVSLMLHNSVYGSHHLSIQFSYITSWISSSQNSTNTTHIDNAVEPYESDDDVILSNMNRTYLQRHIFFLKTHKCASSTLQNIFMRYGLKHNLSFALPAPKYDNLAGFPDYCQPRYIQLNRDIKFNIFCHHCRFHRELIRQLMPAETVFISIVRNPIDVFHSGLRYYLENHISAVNYIAEISDNQRSRDFYSQNLMLFDFGVETTENHTELRRRVLEIVKQFDRILVGDYFDESIILMKEFLNWTMEDVIYVAQNQFMETTRTELNATETALVQEWNYGDEFLYPLVNRTFWKRVRKFGLDRMQSEITQLRALRRQWESTCILKQATNRFNWDYRMKVWHPNALGYILKPDKVYDEACVNLLMPEVQFTTKLAVRQLELFP